MNQQKTCCLCRILFPAKHLSRKKFFLRLLKIWLAACYYRNTLNMVALFHVQVFKWFFVILIVLFSLFLCSQRDHQERPVEHLRPQPRIVSHHHHQSWHRRQKKKGNNKQNLTLCFSCSDYSMQEAGSRKCKENKCKFIVQMTRVQRVPCFSYIMPLSRNYPRNTSHDWLF